MSQPDKKPFFPCTISQTVMYGQVKADPSFYNNSSGSKNVMVPVVVYPFFFDTGAKEEVVLKVYFTNDNHVKLISDFVKKDRWLAIQAVYRTWGDNKEKSGFFATSVELGMAPKTNNTEVANSDMP